MKTTAMLYGPGGAQRVTVIVHTELEPEALVETRDGDRGWVQADLLQDFREEDE